MPALSSLSIARLKTCDDVLRFVVQEVAKVVDVSVLCGRRGKLEQDVAFADGTSKVRWPNSRHNCPILNPATRKFDSESAEDPDGLSLAVDLAPFPIDWKDRDRFILLAGFVLGIASRSSIAVRWGGDWNGNWRTSDEHLHDLPHFELIR